MVVVVVGVIVVEVLVVVAVFDHLPPEVQSIQRPPSSLSSDQPLSNKCTLEISILEMANFHLELGESRNITSSFLPIAAEDLDS